MQMKCSAVDSHTQNKQVSLNHKTEIQRQNQEMDQSHNKDRTTLTSAAIKLILSSIQIFGAKHSHHSMNLMGKQ